MLFIVSPPQQELLSAVRHEVRPTPEELKRSHKSQNQDKAERQEIKKEEVSNRGNEASCTQEVCKVRKGNGGKL